MARRLDLALALCLVAPCGCVRQRPAASDPQGYADRLVAAAPEPAPNTFPTPEAVVTAFFKAIDANDADGAMRCFPVRAYYRAYDVETHFAVVGGYQAHGRVPLPATVDDVGRGLVAVLDYAQTVSRYRQLAFVSSHPDFLELEIHKDDADARAKLDRLEGLRITRQYAVEVKSIQDMALSPLDAAMKVEARKLLLLGVKLGGADFLPQQAVVGRIGDNWRILLLADQ